MKYALCKIALCYLKIALRMFDKKKMKHQLIKHAISDLRLVLFETRSE